MKLHLEPMTETAVYEIMKWRYKQPYHIYNIGRDGQTDFDSDLRYFLNIEYQFHQILNEAQELVAFCSYGSDARVPGGDYSAEAIDIGMGVRPLYTGRGLGHLFAQTAADYAVETYLAQRLRVTIAEFNIRAQKVWQKIGFQPVSKFEAEVSKRPFVIFSKEIL